MIIINIGLLIILIGLTAFFVSSEFAIVKVRSSRIDQLVAEGNPKAEAAKELVTNLDSYLSACQLGITITALGLGWLGEPTVQELINPLFHTLHVPGSVSHILSFIISFSVITFLHVVLGELAPKTFAIQKAEQLTLLIATPLIWFYRIMYPFIWTLNSSARFTAGLFGLEPASEHDMAHSEEELRIILSESYKSGEINQSEYRYVNKIFEFDNRVAKEIMVPRTEIISFEKDTTLSEILSIVKVEKYTRYPVTDGDKDNIVGVVNMKELLTDCVHNQCQEEETLAKYTKPIISVIEMIPIQDLLVKMQKERSHMAILLDEYGGTAGLVTVEDILEEIVGEIRDEFDADEIPLIRKTGEHNYLFDAKVLVEQVNDLLGTHLSDEEVDTIGGWMLTQKYDLKEGDTLEEGSFLFKAHEMEDHHVLYVEVKKAAQS
ncbi:hemolysin family protein [Falsibacillus pallidus]|uniref:CBS domain containing-hemolysin-like protein n=1 Tax=Falsibacillus pallidus TaxID=493781 RepID=A0A370G9J7_9BACI|nr:hemolysin family protein [Falsibacillus pallidus]RDI39880.1 CBS domain containing-hemolysin-like protein [Falsibacillus pallidus]